MRAYYTHVRVHIVSLSTEEKKTELLIKDLFLFPFIPRPFAVCWIEYCRNGWDIYCIIFCAIVIFGCWTSDSVNGQYEHFGLLSHYFGQFFFLLRQFKPLLCKFSSVKWPWAKHTRLSDLFSRCKMCRSLWASMMHNFINRFGMLSVIKSVYNTQ